MIPFAHQEDRINEHYSLSKTRAAISNPRNVAPFAKGELGGPILAMLEQCCNQECLVPNEGGAKASDKRPNALCTPNCPNAVKRRFVFLTVGC